jgi:hypothetical protein
MRRTEASDYLIWNTKELGRFPIMNSTLAKFTRACLALIVLTLLVQAAPAQETVDRVVAVVNDDIITLSEVREMSQAKKQLNRRADGGGVEKAGAHARVIQGSVEVADARQ